MLQVRKVNPSEYRSVWRLYRWRVLGVAVLLLLPGIAIARTQLLGNLSEPAPSVQPLPVETMPLERVTSYEVRRTYTGEITARRSSELGFEQPGTVIGILVQEGDGVSAGQPVARLDTQRLQAQRQALTAERDQAMAQLQELQVGPRPEDIAAARAAVADLEQQVELARLQRTRREALYQEGAIAREELDQQTFNEGSLESRLAQAQTQLDELLAGTRQEQIAAQSARVRQLDATIQSTDVDLEKSVLRAPFAGRVSQRLIDEGVVVASGQSVLRLVEGGTLEARIGVPPAIANRLALGSQQTVQVEGSAYLAEVAAQLPELDTASRTVTVVLQFSAEASLVIGQTAQLQVLETQTMEGYWLPSTALIPRERGLWSVYVLDEETDTAEGIYRVARRDVEVLHLDRETAAAAERVFVRGLLRPGERAIVSGSHRIVPGQEVAIYP